LTVEEIIELLNLKPLPEEGGYFAVSHTSDERFDASSLPDRYHSPRNLSGAIYFLETTEQFSAMHRLPTDELYYFHLGDPLELLLLAPDGNGERLILGPDLKNGQQLQALAPREYWQGSRPLPGGNYGYSLISTSMAPGYAEGDAEFASASDLIKIYPSHKALIQSLTRY